MRDGLKLGVIVVWIVFVLTGCQIPAPIQQSGNSLATQPSPKISMQIAPPADAKMVEVIKEASANLGAVVGIHACIKDEASLRRLNINAVPGVNMVNIPMYYPFPDSTQ